MNENGGAYLAPALAQLAALALEQNVTRAAARSATSQPTLSRSLRAWERDLGIRLVSRRGRAVELTEDGRALAAAAVEALRTIDVALRRLRGEATASSVLAVGSLRSFGPTVTGELIASFLAERTDVLIVHREGSSAELIEGLDDGRLSIVITSPRPPARFEWLQLGHQALVLVVPLSHRLAHEPEVTLSAVSEESFLALDRSFDARVRADALCAAEGFAPRIVLEADNLFAVRDYVAAGMGVAVLPADAAAGPRTAAVPLGHPEARRAIGLAWDPVRNGRTAAELVAHAADLMRRYPGWADIQA